MSVREMAGDMAVNGRVRSAVIVLLWLPVVVVLNGAALGFAVFTVRYAAYGDLPDLSGISAGGLIDPALVAFAALGALAFLYLVLARATFGGETVEGAQEQLEDAAEDADADAEDLVTDGGRTFETQPETCPECGLTLDQNGECRTNGCPGPDDG